MILWLFGLSGSGKTTLANSLSGFYNLDGDELRRGLCKDLGYSVEDRAENLRRAAEVARILDGLGINVVASFITPLAEHREMVRTIIPQVRFVRLDCSLEACIERDTKGMYARAVEGEIKDFTGISSPFEADNELSIDTETQSIEDSIEDLWTIVTHFS